MPKKKASGSLAFCSASMRRKGCLLLCFSPAVTASCRTLDSVSAAPSSESALDAVHIGIFARLVTRNVTSSLMSDL